MRLGRTNKRRCAGAAVESALVMTGLAALIFGALDLGMAVFYQHILSEAVRQGSRAASVHGSLAPASFNGGPWGTSTYGPVAATDSDAKAQAIAPYLTGVDPSTVTVKYEWPDGKNTAESRVQVTLTTTWTPVMAFIFGTGSYTITACSKVPITH